MVSTDNKTMYRAKNILFFALFINNSKIPMNKTITRPRDKFMDRIKSLVIFFSLILEKLTIIKENIDTKIPIKVNILAYI